MRRLVVATFVVALALALAGCSSGSSDSSSASSPPPPPVQVALGSSTLPAIANRSANDTSTFTAFPTGPDVPAALVQKVTVQKQPTLIYFYDSGQDASKEVRSIIDSVRADNRGLVDLVAYDIGKAISVDTYGQVTVDPTFSSGDASAAVKLARDPAIGVSFTPFIVLTDGQGYIIFKHHGLIDRAFLEREVLRAAR